MGDLFLDKGIKPMLIGAEGDAFDSDDYVYERKLDGERCIAYLDSDGTDLRNRRNIKMLPKVPELSRSVHMGTPAILLNRYGENIKRTETRYKAWCTVSNSVS